MKMDPKRSPIKLALKFASFLLPPLGVGPLVGFDPITLDAAN